MLLTVNLHIIRLSTACKRPLVRGFAYKKMAPRGQQSERRLATTTLDDSEANWNRRTGGQADAQDHVLSQADALTKKKQNLSFPVGGGDEDHNYDEQNHGEYDYDEFDHSNDDLGKNDHCEHDHGDIDNDDYCENSCK